MRCTGVRDRVACLFPASVNVAARLQELGWSEGHNIQIDYRSTEGDAELAQKCAAELVALSPDVIVTTGSAGLIPLLAITRTIPIVFTIVPDPVGAGFVDTLARPGLPPRTR